MIQQNSENWEDKTTVKKGNIGEDIVNAYLASRGFVVYSPNTKGAHPFDRLCASRDKKSIFVADSKAKPARKYYPDTGINISHYIDYKGIQEKYKIDVYLFFVDEDKGEVYGNILRLLDEPRSIVHNGNTILYPLEYKGIRYFPLSAMKTIGRISAEQLEQLRALSTRNNAYTPA